ncbi:MAG: hypothetical protein QOI12_4518 [Alphaproteobacteria bacterium]|jgi:SAM-dependent methyltransferase|nr:hypothetical protein [Alphaproteobacteria bacterium]
MTGTAGLLSRMKAALPSGFKIPFVYAVAPFSPYYRARMRKMHLDWRTRRRDLEAEKRIVAAQVAENERLAKKAQQFKVSKVAARTSLKHYQAAQALAMEHAGPPAIVPPSIREDIVGDYWATNRKGPIPVTWMDHPIVAEHVRRRVTGDPHLGTMEFFRRKYFPEPLDLCLSLGCGTGQFERDAISVGFARCFHANDVSAPAIATAKRKASETGLDRRIEYSALDLNQATLPRNTYDAIFVLSAAHHVFELEHLFAQCHAALKPGGIFVLDEYIGPSRFQTAPNVLAIINDLLATLPPRLRRNLFTRDGATINGYTPCSISHFERTDPSEAIRSAEIMPILRLYFDVAEFRPYGGALLHMLLTGIVGNFDEDDERDAAVLDVLCKFEQHLEAAGIIESDFAAIVARPRADIVVPPLQFTPKQPRQAAKAGAKKRRKRPASVPPRKRRR